MKIQIKNKGSPSRHIVLDLIDSDEEEKTVLPPIIDLDEISDDGGDDELLYAPGDNLSASENDEDEQEADVDSTVEIVFHIKKTEAAAGAGLAKLKPCAAIDSEIEEKFGPYGRVLSVMQMRKASKNGEAGLIVRMCGLSSKLREVMTALAGQTIAGVPVEICIRSGKFDFFKCRF